MIHQGGRAVFDRIHQGDQCGVANIFFEQGFIERPPKFFQGLGKILWRRTGDGQAARERTVEMGMSANSARHDDLPSRIQFLCFWVQLLQLGRRPYFADLVAFDQQGMVLQDAIWRFPGDEGGICN